MSHHLRHDITFGDIKPNTYVHFLMYIHEFIYVLSTLKSYKMSSSMAMENDSIFNLDVLCCHAFFFKVHNDELDLMLKMDTRC